MNVAVRRLFGPLLLVALWLVPAPARAADDDDATLLAAPERAPDPERLRHAAEDVLERKPGDLRATRALLVAVTRLRDRDLLDDAIERAKPLGEVEETRIAREYGAALLRRARMDDPPPGPLLERAANALAFAEAWGTARDALDLAHARHLLARVEPARRAYERVLTIAGVSAEDEDLADQAVRGIVSLLGGTDAAEETALEGLSAKCPAVLRLHATRAERLHGPREALRLLHRAVPDLGRSLRTVVLRARLYRAAGFHAAALLDERFAVTWGEPLARGGAFVLEAVEALWREPRPLESFEDCAALERDYEGLLRRAEGFPSTKMAWLNNLAFRFREVVSTYTWRGEGRTQGLAEGAPKAAGDLLARTVALYDGAVAQIPKDAADRPFEERWLYAAILNDAGLMRHYWVDVRDLDVAERLYLRAFELTDGAYMDTYYYNLQYLYGFEKPGSEEHWFRLAVRAQDRILKETPAGGFEPDERKRDAARRDAEALRRRLEEREKPR